MTGSQICQALIIVMTIISVVFSDEMDLEKRNRELLFHIKSQPITYCEFIKWAQFASEKGCDALEDKIAKFLFKLKDATHLNGGLIEHEKQTRGSEQARMLVCLGNSRVKIETVSPVYYKEKSCYSDGVMPWELCSNGYGPQYKESCQVVVTTLMEIKNLVSDREFHEPDPKRYHFYRRK